MYKNKLAPDQWPLRLSALMLMLIAYSYTVARAWSLPIYHDEAVTYLYHARSSFYDILFYTQSFRPNNHLLNTILIKDITALLGASEFVLRIPALLGHALYLIGMYKILKLFLRNWQLPLGLCIVYLNPFLLEYFSAARGYALGLGCSTYGIYYLLQSIIEENITTNSANHKNLEKGYLWLALAVISSFSFFHVYLSILFCHVTKNFLNQKKQSTVLRNCILDIIKPTWKSILLLLATCTIPIYQIIIYKEPIEIGGILGFWGTTVSSLIKGTLYDQTYSQPYIIMPFQIFIGVTICLSIITAIQGSSLKPYIRILRETISWLLTCSLLIIIEGQITHAYVGGRTAIYFIPLFLLVLLTALQSLSTIKLPIIKTSVIALNIILGFLTGFHFLHSQNINKYYMDNDNGSTREAVDLVKKLTQHRNDKDRSISVGTHWIFTPQWNFYILKNHLTWIKIMPYCQDLKHNYDFYYLYTQKQMPFDPNIENDLSMIKEKDLKIIHRFKHLGTYLAVPKQAVVPTSPLFSKE